MVSGLEHVLIIFWILFEMWFCLLEERLAVLHGGVKMGSVLYSYLCVGSYFAAIVRREGSRMGCGWVGRWCLGKLLDSPAFVAESFSCLFANVLGLVRRGC